MKKFSFKKIITVSLFFTSVIFTSGFTICFTDTISTSHSNDQPNATKIDLKDYNGKMLPNRISVPAGKFIDAKALFAQLTLAQGNQSLPWVNWLCYPNQLNISDIQDGRWEGYFTLKAKDNAINYVGGSTALITFDSDNYVWPNDISQLITNTQLTTDVNAFASTPSEQQLLAQIRQVNPSGNVRINSLTVDPSTAVWDKTHVIVGDETHSGSYKVTVKVKPKDPNFTGTVDVYYLVKRSQLTYKNYYELPSIYTSQLENLIMFCDVSDLDVRSILEGEYSFECVNYQLNNNGLSGNANFEFTFTANPYYYDIGSDITIDIFQNGYGIFMLSGSELNNLGLGWSGWSSQGSIVFYPINENSHHVAMFDGVLFDHYFNGEYCMGGNDVVFGDKVRDSSGQEWTVTEAIGTQKSEDTSYENYCGAFGDYAYSGIFWNTIYGTVTINPSLLNISQSMFRGRENMSNIIIPSNSQLVMIGASSLSLGDAVSITVPPQVKLVLNCAFGNQDDDWNYLQNLYFQTNFMIPFIPPDYNLQPYGIVQQFYLTKFEDGSGSGRIYVKTEALRQQYLSDPDWLDFLKPGPAGTLNQMVQVY